MRLLDTYKEYEAKIGLEVKSTTLPSYLMNIRLFIVYMRNCIISNVSDKDVIEYLNLLKETGMGQNTIVLKALAIRRFWDFLYEKEYPVFKPKLIPCLRREPTMPRVATEKEYEMVLNILPTLHIEYTRLRNLAIIGLLWDTGARIGEVLSIDLDDVNIKDMKCVIRTEKSRGKKPFREVYWNERTNTFIKKWIEKRTEMRKKGKFRDEKALFVGLSKNKFGTRIKSNAVELLLRNCSRLLNIPTLNPHSFRHHFGHDLNSKGANNSIISSMMGHSNMASSYIYTELDNKEREDMYNKFKRKG